MQNFAILTDTACDMTAELRERFGIDGYVRGTLNFPDGHSELVAMQDDMKKKQANVSSLINTTKANLAQTQEDLADAQSNVADLEDKINQMVEYEKQLEIQKAKEDAARLAAQQKQSDSCVLFTKIALLPFCGFPHFFHF